MLYGLSISGKMHGGAPPGWPEKTADSAVCNWLGFVPCGTLTVSCVAIPLAMIILTSLACAKTACVACHAFK